MIIVFDFLIFKIIISLTAKNEAMNKSQLIDAMANEAKLSKTETKKALEAFVKITSDALKNGDRIALVGFGSFGIMQRSERAGRNPRSGQIVKYAAKKFVKFKAGSDLANSVQ